MLKWKRRCVCALANAYSFDYNRQSFIAIDIVPVTMQEFFKQVIPDYLSSEIDTTTTYQHLCTLCREKGEGRGADASVYVGGGSVLLVAREWVNPLWPGSLFHDL